jgi:hypothetical protein
MQKLKMTRKNGIGVVQSNVVGVFVEVRYNGGAIVGCGKRALTYPA